MRQDILKAWDRNAAFRFWTDAASVAPLQDLCDALYTLVLLDAADRIHPSAPGAFADIVARRRLAAGLTSASQESEPANVHLTAYVLGTLALLAQNGFDVHTRALSQNGWRLSEIVDPAKALPVWPKAWSHHSWRVSHWVGGACSIMASLERAFPRRFAEESPFSAQDVLAVTDSLIDPKTGFLRCYSSDFLHRLFNMAYAARHNPLAGEVGGIVHVHWVNHALGRIPLKAANPLYASAMQLLERAPFIEKTPYCLDFDVVQIARVAGPPIPEARLVARARQFAQDLQHFFGSAPPDGYTLHRLPGALATWHEAALIIGDPEVPGLDVRAIDIIAKAYWI